MDDEQCEKSTSEKPYVHAAKSPKIANVGQKRESAQSQSNLLLDKNAPKRQRIETNDGSKKYEASDGNCGQIDESLKKSALAKTLMQMSQGDVSDSQLDLSHESQLKP